jgi:hypothetical protein
MLMPPVSYQSDSGPDAVSNAPHVGHGDQLATSWKQSSPMMTLEVVIAARAAIRCHVAE